MQGELDPAWVAALAPEGLGDAELARVRAWSDAEVLAALTTSGAAPWVEALRRRLPLPSVAGFSEKLADWPRRSLDEALGPFVADYDLPRRTALLLELARRGPQPVAPSRPGHPPGSLRSLATLGLIVALPAGFLGALWIAFQAPSGSGRLGLILLAVGGVRMLYDRALRPLLEPERRDEA